MAGRTNDKTSTSKKHPLQSEVSRSPFIETVRSILERDHITSPFTPEQSNQTLEESRHILTSAYANQLGVTPIDYGLPRQQRHNPQLDIVTQDSLEADNTPSNQVRSHQREIIRTNTARRLTSVGGFDQPPSPLESPLDSPRSFNQGISSYSEGSAMAGNIPVGGGGNPLLKYCNFEEYSIYIFLWSPMVLPGEPLVLNCTPMLLIGRSNKSHEVVPSNCKGGSLAPQCGYLSLHV